MHHIEATYRLLSTMVVSMVMALAAHVICCGLVPFALNASFHAALGHAGVEIGFAVLSVFGLAAVLTWWERRRHNGQCTHGGCAHTMPRWMHYMRNLVIGGAAYAFFSWLTHVPFIHHGIEHLIGV